MLTTLFSPGPAPQGPLAGLGDIFAQGMPKLKKVSTASTASSSASAPAGEETEAVQRRPVKVNLKKGGRR